MPKQCCKTCVHSRWRFGANPVVAWPYSGKCVAPISDDIIQHIPSCCVPEFPRNSIYEDDGTDCPLYSQNDGKPKGVGE